MPVQKGFLVIDFDQDANSFKEALASAIHAAKLAGARIERIDPDDLVNASDLACHTGPRRASVSLHARGKGEDDSPFQSHASQPTAPYGIELKFQRGWFR